MVGYSPWGPKEQLSGFTFTLPYGATNLCDFVTALVQREVRVKEEGIRKTSSLLSRGGCEREMTPEPRYQDLGTSGSSSGENSAHLL